MQDVETGSVAIVAPAVLCGVAKVSLVLQLQVNGARAVLGVLCVCMRVCMRVRVRRVCPWMCVCVSVCECRCACARACVRVHIWVL